MARGITLQRYAIENANHYHLRVFRLKIAAVQPSDDMPAEVFLFRRRPVNPATGQSEDEFMGVASPVDTVEYPALAPAADQAYPFFRLAEVTLDFRSTSAAEEAWSLIQAEVCALVAALDRAEQLVLIDETRCGAAADASSESVS